MKKDHSLWNALERIGATLLLGAGVSACAASGNSWKEEVLLHDGQKIIVQRVVERGGRHEVSQQPPIKQQSLAFTLPGTQQRVTWEDPFTADLGTANFLPMLLEAREGVAYLVAHPMGCLSYNKWGRPNPPYVVFAYQRGEWRRIALQELPIEFKSPNLIFSSPDDEAKNSGQSTVSAETIKGLYAGYRQPEFRSVLREELSREKIVEMCGDRVLYKGHWIVDSPTARAIVDFNQKIEVQGNFWPRRREGIYSVIGNTAESIANTAAGVSGFDSHSQALLMATLTLKATRIVDGKAIRLSPGMNLTRPGTEGVIEFLLSPIQRAGNESLRER